MNKVTRNIAIAFAMTALFGAASARAQQSQIAPQATWVAEKVASMGVETKWIAGAHIDWLTGLPDGEPELHPGQHTHCSAFVAATAQALGIYILRPPEHRQELLANAQNEWLASEGRSYGWFPLSGAIEAQNAANRGEFVVASYHNHRSDKPGHIAVVLPSKKTATEIASEGPTVAMAGTFNSASVSVKLGFAGHPHAWADNEIDYYAHDVRPLPPVGAR